MTHPIVGTACLILLLAPTPVLAQTQKAKPGTGNFAPFAGTSSREPIAIEADRLEVFDKEQRAVYSGGVIVRQGETTMKSAQMTVFYNRENRTGAQANNPAKPEADDPQAALRKVEAKGGVTVSSRTQVATGDEGVYDRVQNKITLIGNVALSDGPNITKGEKLVYDLTTGIAVIERGANARVKGLFVPADAEKKDTRPARPN